MNNAWTAAVIFYGVLILLNFLLDRFGLLSKLADRFEKKVLKPFRLDWDTHGDPASWFHHAGITALAGAIGGLISLKTGGAFWEGFQAFSALTVVAYALREGNAAWEQRGDPGFWWRGGGHKTGWGVDGAMDVIFPAIVCWLSY